MVDLGDWVSVRIHRKESGWVWLLSPSESLGYRVRFWLLSSQAGSGVLDLGVEFHGRVWLSGSVFAVFGVLDPGAESRGRA